MNKVIQFPDKELVNIQNKVIKLTTSIKADLINLAQKRTELLNIQKELRKIVARPKLTIVKDELTQGPRT